MHICIGLERIDKESIVELMAKIRVTSYIDYGVRALSYFMQILLWKIPHVEHPAAMTLYVSYGVLSALAYWGLGKGGLCRCVWQRLISEPKCS